MRDYWKKHYLVTRDQIQKQASEKGDDRKKLAWLLERVATSKIETSDDRVEKFVFALSALVHHLKRGGLSNKQVKDIAQIARDILELEKIPVTKHSAIGARHAELYVILSQIERADGEHFLAARDQHLAFEVAGQHIPGGTAFHRFVYGNRLQRLGFGELAQAEYREIDMSKLDGQFHLKLLVSQIYNQWTLGHKEEVENLLGIARGLDLEEHEAYLEWLELTMNIQSTEDVKKVVVYTQKNESHLDPSTVLEAHLWVKASGLNQNFYKRLPRLAKMSKKDFLGSIEQSFFTCVKNLDRVSSQEYKRPEEVEVLFEMMGQSSRFLTLQKELLFLGASLRVLIEHRHFSMAALAFQNYQNRCHQVSGRRTDDILNLFEDVNGRGWAKAQ